MNQPMLIFLLHFAATAYMTGVIWLVQLYLYRYLNLIDSANFGKHHRRYNDIMGLVVGPAMLIELVSCAALPFLFTEAGRLPAIASIGVLVVIWISTFALQVPCHMKLRDRYDAAIHQRLVQSNWIRTAGWTARAVLLIVAAVMEPSALQPAGM